MTNYSDLVQRLRNDKRLSTYIRSMHMKDGFDPSDITKVMDEAADAIEAQAKLIEELKEVNENQRVAINELRLVNSFEDVAWKAKDERIAELEAAQLAQDKLILEYCSRITELEFALQPFADEAQFFVSKALDNHLAAPDRLYLTIGQFRAARKVLGEKE